MRNTVSNGHGKRSPRAMASTASERSSTLPWEMSMIESSGGGVRGGVCGEVGGEVGGEVCSGVGGVLEVGGGVGCKVGDEVGDEVCSAVDVVLEVGGVLEVGTHARAG